MFDPRLRHALAALPEPVIIGHHSRVDPQVKTIDAQAPATFVTLCSMRIHVLPTPEIAAERAAEWLRTEIGRASAQRGRCLVALSGGRTPWRMLRDLRRLRVHWHDLQVFQVDERVVPENDERRNARQIADLLVAPAMLHAGQFHAMPVERSISERAPRSTPGCSANMAERRRYSTWSSLGWAPTAIPPRWCLVTSSSRRTTAMSESAFPTRGCPG